jgi:mono/diheme cytochrome c family protein
VSESFGGAAIAAYYDIALSAKLVEAAPALARRRRIVSTGRLEAFVKFVTSTASVALGVSLGISGLVAHATGIGQQTITNFPAAARKVKSPLPKSKENILAGAAVFQQNCSGCHGPSGVPTRKFANLATQPANLTQENMKRLSDGEMFWVLTHGAPGGMPSFADDLSEGQRWQCIQFVRRLGKDADKYTAQLPPAGGR